VFAAVIHSIVLHNLGKLSLLEHNKIMEHALVNQIAPTRPLGNIVPARAAAIVFKASAFMAAAQKPLRYPNIPTRR
jgi:hypothetical protein